MEKDLIVVTPEVQEIGIPEPEIYTNRYTKHSKARNTIKAYQSDWADFHNWCFDKQCRALPANPKDVADYLSDRATHRWEGPSGKAREKVEKPPLKWNTLERRLTTICKMHQHMNQPFNRRDPAIETTMSGIKRLLSQEHSERIVETRKDPTLMEDIRKMIQAISIYKDGQLSIIGIRDRALLLIGFAGALRRSEIVKIKLEHVKFVKEGIELLIPWSKTGRRDLAIPFGSNPETCPVRSLQEWLRCSGIIQGFVFPAINKWGQIQPNGLTDRAVSLIIQRNPYIKQLMEDGKSNPNKGVPDFGGHSLRAGFVSQAINNGVPEHIIMAHTGHKKSDTLKKYIRQTNKWKDNAATKLGL